MAAEPSANKKIQIPPDSGSDLDAEGEDDHDLADHTLLGHSRKVLDKEGSELDAEFEVDNEAGADGEDDEALAAATPAPVDDAEGADIDGDIAVVSDEEDDSGSGDAASEASSDSEGAIEWAGESDDAEEGETEFADRNNCIYCDQDEENDPSDEYEEYLSCSVCGDHAHRQCARNAGNLDSDTDAEHWRCQTCVDSGLETYANKNVEDTNSRRTAVNPKIAKELLPGGRGVVKPDSHSVFNTLILDDDPLDGSRSLRKRKSTEEAEPQRISQKRRRVSGAGSASAGADRSTSAESSRKREDRGLNAAMNGQDGLVADEVGSLENASRYSRRPRKTDKSLCYITSNEGISLIVSFGLNQQKLQRILATRPRKNRWREKQRRKKILPPQFTEPEMSHYPGIDAGFTRQLYAAAEREQEKEDGKNLRPYGGILSEIEANTEKTFPQEADRKRFEDARQRAEDDWKKLQAEISLSLEPSKPVPKSSGPPSKIKCINFGGYEIDTWNAAPYPEEYSRNRLLYICEFCLKYMNSDYVAWRHKLKCPAKHPPGDEIYRDGKYSFFEVDGRKNPVYCQNLCLMAKLFLGSKTLYYDVEPFLFYVMTENDEFGCHFVGYFSKEKRPSSMNNVSCILVMPIYQRRGFGHMLIDFSYLLTKTERKTGSPEKPLSDMGLVSYRGYWRLTMSELLRAQHAPLSISDISETTGMTADDIISALEGLRALIRDPVTKTYAIRVDHTYCQEYIDKHARKNYPKIEPERLIWTPYIMNRGLTQHYEEAIIQTVAPREDDAEDAASKSPFEQPLEVVAKDGAKATDGPEPVAVPILNGLSPRLSRSRSRSQPGTPEPRANNAADHQITSHPSTVIPPGRFEIYPPVPGYASTKRRTGRPFGSRTRTRSHLGSAAQRGANGSPSRRVQVAHARSASGSPIGHLRRTRSNLGSQGHVDFETKEVGFDANDAENAEADQHSDVDGEQPDAGDGQADAEGEEEDDEDAEGEEE